MRFDPVLIKFGVFALVAVVRTVTSLNNKRKRSNDNLRPPQSAPGPPPIASPTVKPGQPPMNQPPMPRNPNPPKGKSSSDGSPWSSSKGPFD